MVAIRATIVGAPDLQAALERMNPGQNKRIVRNSLIRSALEVQKESALNQILRGRRGPPVPHKLTSRTGTLRRSIAVNRGPLPFAIEIGTDLVYGPVHEFGSKTHPKRPFLKPALAAIAPKFGRIVIEEWKKEARL